MNRSTMGRRSKARGHERERVVAGELVAQGFFVVRVAGSLGDVDLVALRARGAKRTLPHTFRLPLVPRRRLRLLVEVKSTAGGPFERFTPVERRELLEAAELAGATPVLAYCPPGRRPWRWIWASEWPS